MSDLPRFIRVGYNDGLPFLCPYCDKLGTYGLVGVITDETHGPESVVGVCIRCLTRPEVLAEFAERAQPVPAPGEAVWCAKSVEGWCAVAGGVEPAEGSFSIDTICGEGITLPGGYDLRVPDCADCCAVIDAAVPAR